jgi:hypothetical protein
MRFGKSVGWILILSGGAVGQEPAPGGQYLKVDGGRLSFDEGGAAAGTGDPRRARRPAPSAALHPVLAVR